VSQNPLVDGSQNSHQSSRKIFIRNYSVLSVSLPQFSRKQTRQKAQSEKTEHRKNYPYELQLWQLIHPRNATNRKGAVVMGKTKFKISQFVPILPFGYTSRSALCIAGSDNPMAWVEYDPNTTMDERELVCSRQWQYANAHIKSMIEQGFLEEVERKYGKHHWEVFPMVRLTAHGYELISGRCTSETEYDRVNACVNAGMGYRAASEYLPPDIIDTHLMLQDAKEQTGVDHHSFIKILMRTIARDDVTLMAYSNQSATIDFTSQFYNGHRQYRSWKISNINALFRANGFLTAIDRRPIYLTEDNTKPDMTISEGDAMPEGEVAFYDHCKAILARWYDRTEESFLFSYPWASLHDGLDLGGHALPWEQIPAFYSAHEFPGFSGSANKNELENLTGALNLARHNLTGIAVGLKHNYLVYHTRPHHTPMSDKIEENSCLTAQHNIDLLNEESPIFGANREIRNSIIVCPTVKQFKSLFTNLNKKTGRKNTMNPINGVYDSMCIVPLNNSGVAQLRRLMASSPIECETELVHRLSVKYPQFQRTNDPIYQLAFNNKPVHVAHYMCYDKLYTAWQAYQHGRRFYIMCYPEQVKYLRQLFPDAEYL
jgi:hypothetical protein